MAPSSAGRRHSHRPAALLLAAVFLAGCGTISTTPPPATPTDFPGLAGRLSTAGIKAADWVSGDPGCQDPNLAKTAIRFDASGLDQAEPVTLYLYIFRNRDAFERNRAVRTDRAVAVRRREPGALGTRVQGRPAGDDGNGGRHRRLTCRPGAPVATASTST